MRGIRAACVGVLLASVAVPLAASAAPTTAPAHAVGAPLTIPALRQWTPSSDGFRLRADTEIVVPSRSDVAIREAGVLAADLGRLTHRVVQVAVGARPADGDVALRLSGADQELGREGYQLQVGRILTISAPAAAGLFYGGRSLLQLLHQGQAIPGGVARDWPTYSQRGLMVDASRTVYSTAWVLREIHRLAAIKLNVLHLHLTDDQRWAIASREFPEVVAKQSFSRAEIRRIVGAARRNHVMVIPEIEMPGHMASFLKVHPELILKPAGVVSPTTSGTYTTDKLDITSAAALAAMRRVLDEYLPLFPGKYWDMGTDEYLSPAEYPLFPQLVTYAVAKYGVGATPADAVHGFINWVDHIVRAHGKTLRIWNDQVGGTVREPVNRDVVIDWWDSFSPFGDPLTVSPGTLLAQGYRVLNAGWYPNYYTSDIGPLAGKASLPGVYADWQVNKFEGTQVGKVGTSQSVPPGSPGLVGSALSIWGPLDETTGQTAREVEPHLAVLAQKTWNTKPAAATYGRFARDQRRVGLP